MDNKIDIKWPTVYAIWATGSPDGPLAGQSGYLAEDDSLLLFGDTEAVERKIRDLQNRCMNGHPAAVFESITCDRNDRPTSFMLAEDIAQYDLQLDTDHLEYELQTQAYGNTGGGCMVGTQSFYLPELGKTVWVNCDGEGVTVTSADYVWNDDHSNSWDRYEDVLLFSTQFADTPPEELGAWLPMVRETLAYTMEQQAAHGRRAFDLPGRWLPEEQEPPPGPTMDTPC